MLLGLDSISHHLAFGCHMDLFSFIDRVSEYGLSGFQINPLHLVSRDKDYLKAVRGEAHTRHLFIEHGMLGVAPDDIRRNVEICRTLGATVLRTYIGIDRYSRSPEIATELANARDLLVQSVDLLESSGVRLAIENHGDVRSQELVDLVEDIASPSVGICLDVANSLCVLEDPLEAARRMTPFVVSVQFKDYTIAGTPTGCKIAGTVLGRGVLPLQDLYQLILDEAPVDRLMLEIPLEGEHALKGEAMEAAAIRESIHYCREVLGIGAD